jgi:hypothetical protein
MQNALRPWLIFLGLAAFVPLVYYLAVVGGLLSYGGILLITIRNFSDASLRWFGLGHLLVYGLLLSWLARVISRLIDTHAKAHAGLATAAVLVLLAGVGAMPIFGIAHGQIQWATAYELYRSDRLR